MKKILLLSFLTITALAFTSCYNVTEIEEKTEKTPVLEDDFNEEVLDDDIIEVTNEVVEDEVVPCENMEWEELASCMDKVYLNESVKSKDITICDKISTEDWKDNCKDNFELSNAIQFDSSWNCSNIKDDYKREKCEMNNALQSSLKMWDVKWCAVLEWESRNKCESETLINLAIQNMDKSQCEKIEIAEDKETCNSILNSILWE